MFNAYSEEKIEADEIDRGSLEIREMVLVLVKGILTTNGLPLNEDVGSFGYLRIVRMHEKWKRKQREGEEEVEVRSSDGGDGGDGYILGVFPTLSRAKSCLCA